MIRIETLPQYGTEHWRCRVALDAVPDAVFVTDPEALRYVEVNDSACAVLGYPRERLLRMGPREVLGEAPERLRDAYAQVISAGGADVVSEHGFTREDGRQGWTELHRRAVRLGERWLIVTVARDITDRRQAEEAAREHERLRDTLMANLPGMAYRCRNDPQWTLEYASEGAYALTGHTPDELVGNRARAYADLIRAEDREPVWLQVQAALAGRRPFEMEYRIRTRAGDERWVWERGRGVFDKQGELLALEGYITDVTERVHYEERLEYHASHDALTGLPNRTMLNDRLEQAILQRRRGDGVAAVLFIDLDDFKRVNDSLGHLVGDKLLCEVARRIGAALREADTVARVGGDEFVVVLPELKSEQAAAHVAEKIQRSIAAPLELEQHEFVLSSCIGISMSPKDGDEAVTLLRNADTALYRAKDQGRDCYRFFAPDMNERIVAYLRTERELRRALESREFRLEYQPIVDLASRRPVGFEALIRWRTREGATVAPSRFIPVAEESGLIVPIGRWVIETAARDAARLAAAGRGALFVSVNVSARQFADTGLLRAVRDALHGGGFEPSRLQLELTESTVMRNPEDAIGALRALKGLGVRLALDDFGVGYSSLSYLKRFPLDALKIDRGFVRDVPQDSDDVALCRSVADLARAMELEAVAEGIETEAQARVLRKQGYHLGQGFLFAPPAPLEAFLE